MKRKACGFTVWLGVTEREQQYVWRTVRENRDVSQFIHWKDIDTKNRNDSIYLASNANLKHLYKVGFGVERTGIDKHFFVCQTVF